MLFDHPVGEDSGFWWNNPLFSCSNHVKSHVVWIILENISDMSHDLSYHHVIIMLSSYYHQLWHSFAIPGMWQLDCPNILACRKSHQIVQWPGRGWPLALCCWSLTSTSCWFGRIFGDLWCISCSYRDHLAKLMAWMSSSRNHQKPISDHLQAL